MSEQKDKSEDEELVNRRRTEDKKRKGTRGENYELPSERKVQEELKEGVE